MPRTPKRDRIEVENLKHDEASRVNIPTAETSDFMTDEQREGTVKDYDYTVSDATADQRDRALDPQLWWRGKDVDPADGDLRVLVRPIYRNEQIHPRAIIENVRALAAQGMPMQLSLFDDFNGLPLGDAVEFYEHEQHWTNRMILGDSLAVMASLAEMERLRGKVQMIYIDPPYGIKFNSNWQPSTLRRDVKDGKDVTYEPEQIQAFRDTWEDGIHSYLGYLRDRLVVARELLTESGSIFVQIGDENVHLVRNLLDEVFGAGNFVSIIIVEKTSSSSTDQLSSISDFVLWYARNAKSIKFRQLYREKALGEQGATQYIWVDETQASNERRLLPHEETQPAWRVFAADNLTSQRPLQAGDVDKFRFRNEDFTPGSGTFKTNATGLRALAMAARLKPIGKSLMYKRYLADFPVFPLANIWSDVKMTGFTEDKIYVVQTGTKVIQRCVLMTTDPGDIVLDPTCGSGTTAYVAEQWGRRWITIDTSRVALALARTRLMSAKFPSYTLKTGKVSDGFIYKTVPHITLKSIANNAQIDVIHERYQPALDDLRAQINAFANKPLEEWEIPRPTEDMQPEIVALLNRWWELRRQRQAEIDAAINTAADSETLVDQPEVKPKTIRVTGPFTVESLQPHRALGTDSRLPDPDNAAQFAKDMIDQLRESTVVTSRKGEQITFSSIDLYPGRMITASGTYEQAGKLVRVAVLIGPQYGTVSRDMIEKAALEAVRQKADAFDMLLVCGFAFDPMVVEEAKNYGKLIVQTARINPDLLLMGSKLKSRPGLFTTFGEPDVTVEPAENDQLVVRLNAMDVYDPNKREVRSSEPREIACWFIDTNYNDKSFFVRHAYFTGEDKPYERLKAALRADIDSEAWETLYRTESIPFDRPASGMIAVKVINHYGDEVMKVIKV